MYIYTFPHIYITLQYGRPPRAIDPAILRLSLLSRVSCCHNHRPKLSDSPFHTCLAGGSERSAIYRPPIGPLAARLQGSRIVISMIQEYICGAAHTNRTAWFLSSPAASARDRYLPIEAPPTNYSVARRYLAFSP